MQANARVASSLTQLDHRMQRYVVLHEQANELPNSGMDNIVDQYLTTSSRRI